MTQNKTDQFTVGLFVLAGLTSLFVVLALLTGKTGPTDTYFTTLENVAGIKFGTQVVYEGYPIGQVEELNPVDDNGQMKFNITMGIRKNWRIPSDSSAIVFAPSVLAAKTILIKGGKSPDSFSPGDTLPSAPTPDIFGAMQKVASTFTDLSKNGLFPLIRNLNQQITLAGELLEGDLKVLMGNLSATSEDIQSKTPVILNNVEEFSRDLATAGGQIDKAMSDKNLASIQNILKNADATSQRLADVSNDIQTLLNETRPDVDAASDDLRFALEAVARHIDAITHNIDAASLQMLEFSRQIRNNPGVLLRGTEPASGEELRGPDQ